METINKVVETLQERLPEKEILAKEVLKNGAPMVGIQIRTEGSNISPVFYVEDMIKAGHDAEEIADETVAGLASERLDAATDFAEELNTFEKVKDLIRIKVVSRKAGEGNLAVPFLDLAIVPIVSKGEMCAAITSKLAEHWGVKAEEVMKTAWKHTMDIPADTMDFGLFTAVMLQGVPYGAAVMANQKEMDRMYKELCGDTGADMIILPSSVHEIVCFKDDDENDFEALRDMICAVNESDCRPNEVLSDHPYYYNPKKGGWVR